MKKLLKLLFIITPLLIFTKCALPDESLKNDENIDLSILKIENGILNLPSKDYILQIVKEFKTGVKEQNDFYSQIKKLQDLGYKPLTPFLNGLTTNEIQEFVVRKKERINKRNIDFGLYQSNKNSQDLELDIDDELISDPVLSSLLNENREIIIADILYKYTELGLFYIEKQNKQVLYDYYDNKTPQERYALINQYNNEHSTTDKPQEIIEQLGQGLTTFRISMPDTAYTVDEYGGGGGGGSSAPTGGNGVFNPADFGACEIMSQGFFEQIFGESESCYDYYNDNRRVKVKYFNQNFGIFSSIGCSTRLQKREHLNLLFGTISWWEKSYAQKIRMGVNNLTYTYNFNVPVYNSAQYNYQTTFFEYNNVRYNINGQVIPTIPTSAGSFNFPVDNNNNVIDITVLGYNAMFTNGQVNQAIDAALDQIISSISTFALKQDLITKKAEGNLVVRTVYVEPFSNKIKFIVANQFWASNDDNAVVKYFDFNFLLTYNSSTNYNPNNTQQFIDLLQTFNGARQYDDVKIDMFGAALHNNYWKGRKLLKN
ncbi:hypothetical protein [Flavobacterium sp.]|uniref:hypothetical protein n=1 Tax=Flavobacterium sp. TaxID=239 RepID=UPI003753D9AC